MTHLQKVMRDEVVRLLMMHGRHGAGKILCWHRGRLDVFIRNFQIRETEWKPTYDALHPHPRRHIRD